MSDTCRDIRNIAIGDHTAFTRLYRTECRKLITLATGLLAGDRAAAEDVVDAAFFAVWRGAGCFRGQSDAEARAWLRGIVRNKAIDWLRANGRYDLGWDGDACAPDPEISPELSAIGKDATARLSAALACLSLEHREAVMLCYYEDLPLAEIAAITGCPEGTVKTRLFHARKALRCALPGDLAKSSDKHITA